VDTRAPQGGYETLPGEFRSDTSYAFSFAQYVATGRAGVK
jgi:hypothetical protein